MTNSPQNIDKHNWYYEEPQGLYFIHQVCRGDNYLFTDNILIPWHMIRTSLARKDRRRLPRAQKRKRDGKG